MNRRIVSVCGIVFGVLLAMQPLFADNHGMMSDEGLKLTIKGSVDAQGTTGIKTSKKDDAAGATTDIEVSARDSATSYREQSEYYQESSKGEFNASLSFDASWDNIVGVYLGLNAEESTDTNLSGSVANASSTLNLRNQLITIDEAYAWMELLPTALVAPSIFRVQGKVGLFSARPNISPEVIDSDLLDIARGDAVEYDAETDTQPGSVGQLEIEVLDMVTLQTLLYFGDWNRHDAADLGIGLLFDSGSLISEDHKIGASVSLVANLRDTNNDEYALTADELDTLLDSDTLSFMVNYDGTFGDLKLNTHLALGLNNLVGWANPDDETVTSTIGTTTYNYTGSALANPDMFIGWVAGIGVSYAEWIQFRMGLSGHGEIKRLGQSNNADTNDADVLRRSKPVENILLRLDSDAIKVLTGDVFDLALFIQAHMILGDYDNYFLRSVDLGAKYTIVNDDTVNVWAQFGYGIALADPDNENSFVYDTDFMAVETPGVYFKAGGDFTKVIKTGM